MQNNQSFTQPEVLRQIDPRRINLLLRRFSAELTAARVALPDHEALNGEYHSAIEHLLAGPLPDRLRTALSAIETAAAPENAAQLDALIKQHIPNVGINPAFPLDCALEVWFHAPDQLAQFQPSAIPSPRGPRIAERSTLVGHQTGGGLGKPLGQGEGEFSSNNPHIHESINPHPASLPLTDPPTHPLTNSVPNSQPSTLQLSTSSLPWPSPVDGKLLLDELAAVLRRFVVLPVWAAEALALWIVHTFAFQLRDVSAYIGIESPEKRCGKTTLLTLVSQLVNRPVVAPTSARLRSSVLLRNFDRRC